MTPPLWQEEAELDLRRRFDEEVAKMNEMGIPVICTDTLKVGMGCIWPSDDGYVCLIKKNLPLTAQFFTLLHEHEHALDMSRPNTPAEERRINRKVAAQLVPADTLADYPEIYDADELVTVLEEKAIRLGVSFSTLCVAQQEQGRISRQTYEMLIAGRGGIPAANIAVRREDGGAFLPLQLEPGEKQPLDRDYRLPGDPPHWVRVRQLPPEGFSRLAEEVAMVAGISLESYRQAAVAFMQGRRRRLLLRREGDNPADRNAIQVVGVWRDRCGQKGQGALGYVPRQVAARVAAELEPGAPLAATLILFFAPGAGRSPGIRFSLWSQ